MPYPKLSRLMAAGVFLLALAHVAQASEADPTVAQEILALDMAWGEAAAKGDGPLLEKLLAGELYHVHASGNSEGKAAYIEALASGKRKHDPIVPQEVQVRVYGETAVSTGKFKMVAYKEGMPKPMVDQTNLYTHVWRKSPTGWQLVLHQATAEGGMKMGGMKHEGMDHSAMGHEGMKPGSMEHGAMKPGSMGHEGMNHGAMPPGK